MAGKVYDRREYAETKGIGEEKEKKKNRVQNPRATAGPPLGRIKRDPFVHWPEQAN